MFNDVFIKDCKDEAELAVAFLLLSKVPEDCADKFAILYDAADRMDEDDVLTPIDKVAIALVNCVDEDVITVSKDEFTKEMKNRFFDRGGQVERGITDDIQFFNTDLIRYDLEMSFENDMDSVDLDEEEELPESLYSSMKMQYHVGFDESDTPALVAFMAEKGLIDPSTLEEHFDAEAYAEAFFSISGSKVFGPEVYEKDGTVLTTPNFNYDITAGVCMAAEELVYAIREGKGVAEHRAELEDQLVMMGIEAEYDEPQRQSLDELQKEADEFFTYPEGTDAPEKSKDAEVR